VLNLLLKGQAPSFIASKLKMNVKTISGQKRAAMRKYNVTSTVELVVKHRLCEEIKCAGVKRARG
jgi:DNA-binding CsgD family transcriptional regulator